MAKKGKKVRTETEKAEDFKKIAAKHANSAIRAISRLEKMANPNKYHYTPSQVQKLSEAFRAALTACFAAYEGKKTASAGIEL